MLNGFYSARNYPAHLSAHPIQRSRVRQHTGLLTNNTALPALTIAALYKNRWQVELFFTCIKQHLRIKHFPGTAENALKKQVWCAVATYVLIAIVKKELQRCLAVHVSADLVGLGLRENPAFMRLVGRRFPS